MSITTDVALTDEQEMVMGGIDAFMADRTRRVFTLHGLAGTGKTTLLAHVARQYRHDALCTLTGKAASVLRSKAGLKAGTLHGYFYDLIEKKRDEQGRAHLKFANKHIEDELTGDVVLVDECSMVPMSIGQQLMRTGARVIAVGDPGQLPPVKEAGFFNRAAASLHTIHRQALESPIIRQALAVREGRNYQPDGEHFRIMPMADEAELAWADIALCWTNRTRQSLNATARRLAGRHAPHPEAGEPLLCLQNAPRYGVYNGGIYTAARDILPTDGGITVLVDGEETYVERAMFAPVPANTLIEPPTVFDYGYCLTVHKAQGSEWDRVLLVDEYRAREHRREWLYTGLTRAARSIIVVPA